MVCKKVPKAYHCLKPIQNSCKYGEAGPMQLREDLETIARQIGIIFL
jgi:hypothetical protein